MTSLSRSYLQRIADAGLIETVKLGAQDNRRVARLIDTASLLAYIESHRASMVQHGRALA